MEVPIQGGISASHLLLTEQKDSLISRLSESITHLEVGFDEIQSFSKLLRPLLEAHAGKFKYVLSSRSLNLASTDEINFEVLKALKEVCSWLKPEVVHDSLSWSALDGHHTYLELPFPLTESNLELLVERVFRIQECLGRKIAIRNTHPLVKFVGAEFSEAGMLLELARITGCELVLDQVSYAGEFAQIPSDFIKLQRVNHRTPEFLNNLVAPTIILGGSLDEQLALVARSKPQIATDLTDRLSLEPLVRREVELKEGIFEFEPRKILIEEITRGFGIRANADIAVFESQPEPRDGMSKYNQQYFIQIRNLLQGQFRAVAYMLSGQFDRIVVEFLNQYPPTEAFIYHVGRDFEYFLRESEHPQAELLGDLARLEHSMVEVMEAPEQAAIDQGVMMEIASDLWDRVIFKLNDQVRLIDAGFDVAKIQKNILSKGKVPEAPKVLKTHFLVYRMDNQPHVQMIGRPEAKALRYARSELTFIKICEQIAQEEGLPLDQVIQQTFSFIHRWAGLGLVKAFDFKAPTQVIAFEGTAWDHDKDIEA